MDAQTRRDLQEDYAKVQKEIGELVTSNRPNSTISQPHYLTPSIYGEIRPIEDPLGEYAYFTGIRSVLEKALKTGKLECGTLPHKAPLHLRKLLSSD